MKSLIFRFAITTTISKNGEFKSAVECFFFFFSQHLKMFRFYQLFFFHPLENSDIQECLIVTPEFSNPSFPEFPLKVLWFFRDILGCSFSTNLWNVFVERRSFHWTSRIFFSM